MAYLPVLLALVLVAGCALSVDVQDGDVDVDMEDIQFVTAIQLASDGQKAADKAEGDGQASEAAAGTGDRRKRAAGNYGNGYNYGRSARGYDLYPSLNRFVGNGYLADAVYNPVDYVSRLPYYGNSVFSRFRNLPVFRFYNQFYPAGLVSRDNGLVRNYVRFNTGFVDAVTDFRALPVVNVREVATTQTTVTTERDLEADIYGVPNGRVVLRRSGCSLNGIRNGGFPCLTVSLRSPVFGTVLRRFNYLNGFDNNFAGLL